MTLEHERRRKTTNAETTSTRPVEIEREQIMLRIGMLIRSFPSKQVPGVNAWLVPALLSEFRSLRSPVLAGVPRPRQAGLYRTNCNTNACLHASSAANKDTNRTYPTTPRSSPRFSYQTQRDSSHSSLFLLPFISIKRRYPSRTRLLPQVSHTTHLTTSSSGPVSPTALPSHSTRLPEIARLISTGNHSTTPNHH